MPLREILHEAQATGKRLFTTELYYKMFFLQVSCWTECEDLMLTGTESRDRYIQINPSTGLVDQHLYSLYLLLFF